METTLQDAIANAGLGRPDIIHDGKIHRFSSPDDKSGNKNCWYAGYGTAAAFGCWKNGINQRWHNGNPSTAYNPELTKQIESARIQRGIKIQQKQQQARETAQNLFDSGSRPIIHDYPKRKQITPYRAKQNIDVLLVPMYLDDELVNLQRIFPDGTKRFLKGGRIKGCYLPIGKLDKTLYICEGYATGCSLHEYTGQAVAVAFNAGNLASISRYLRDRHPAIKIIIAADNDAHSSKNTGLDKARTAADLIGAAIIYPDFKNEEFSGTDFNDYLIAGGKL